MVGMAVSAVPIMLFRNIFLFPPDKGDIISHYATFWK